MPKGEKPIPPWAIKLNLSVEFLLEDENIIDKYLASNLFNLTGGQIEILGGFKRKIRRNFVILNAQQCIKLSGNW